MLRHKEVVVEDVQLDALPPTVLPLVGLRVGHDVVSGREKREFELKSLPSYSATLTSSLH